MRSRNAIRIMNLGLGRWCISMGIVLAVAALVVCDVAVAQGWMTYRHDNARSGMTAERVAPPLSLSWMFQPAHPPQPAWYEPAEELPRTRFDSAYHVTVADNIVYFGSSVDNKVYALNAKTGETEWTFFTEGPVRFAPTLCEGRVYVGSDDGNVYCLNGINGELIWKYRVGPSDQKVIGNGHMISMWPVRTNVLVADGIAYFSAGVFPYEGLYICALDAETGTAVWRNDTIGDRAHELNFGGISPQGYLIASDEVLYVPSSRAMPAAFDRKDGTFLYYLSPPGKVGGTWALLDKNELIAGVDRSGIPGKVTYEDKTGRRIGDAYAWFPGIELVITPDVSYILTEHGIVAINRKEYPAINAKLNAFESEREKLRAKLFDLRTKLSEAKEKERKEIEKESDAITEVINSLGEEENVLKSSACKWRFVEEDLCALILADNVLFAAGDNIILAVDAETGEKLWNSAVDGEAVGLAATDGRVLVSTDNGRIYCFAEEKASKPKEWISEIQSDPYPEGRETEICENGAENILRNADIERGWCLVLGAGEGNLVFELAKRTDLMIVGIEPDPQKVEKAKRLLDAAG
ncbi:MAG: PQQ-binding-like beta-propeller repeat protein, partial [bacterium]